MVLLPLALFWVITEGEHTLNDARIKIYDRTVSRRARSYALWPTTFTRCSGKASLAKDVQEVDNARTIMEYRLLMGSHTSGRLLVMQLALEVTPCRVQQESSNRR